MIFYAIISTFHVREIRRKMLYLKFKKSFFNIYYFEESLIKINKNFYLHLYPKSYVKLKYNA